MRLSSTTSVTYGDSLQDDAAAARVGEGNLPVPISSFVGRTDEIATTLAALASARLVTLTGTGGVGKTRLSLEVATALRPQFPEGVWFVDLAHVSSCDLVCSAIASALGMREERGDSVRALVAHLRPRCLLLVLDNCEHVLDMCAEITSTLLTSCSAVSVLATSREPLRIPGEQLEHIGPLPVPAADEDDRRSIERCASVRLFVERATSMRPAFRLDARAGHTIAKICRRLDGIPLAIELAAARVHALPPDEILAKLEDRFRFLTKGDRSAMQRHQTLGAALDWSYELLSPPEQALFCRLAVFSATFCSESVEQVCLARDIAKEDAVALIEQLVAKSLVAADPTATCGRFRMLETVREYAWRKLDPAEQAEIQQRHAGWYVALATAAEPRLVGPDGAEWLERTEAEHEEFRGALSWSLAHGRPEMALKLAGSMTMFWRLRGHWSTGRQLLERALTQAEGAHPAVRAKALWGLALLAGTMGEVEAAVPAAEHSLQLYRELDDAAGASRALAVMAQVWIAQHPPRALDLAQESLRLANEAHDHWAIAESLALAAQAHLMTGRLSESSRLFGESLEVAQASGNRHGAARALLGIGAIPTESGKAQPILEEALRLTRDLGDDYDAAEALLFLGNLSVIDGHLDVARAFLEDCLTLAQEIGSPRLRARVLAALGRLALAEGHHGTAAFLFDEGTSIARELSLNFILVRCLAGRGQAAANQSDHDTARSAWKEALEVAQTSSDRDGAATTLLNLAHLARAEGDDEQAGSLVNDCLQSAHAIGLEGTVAVALALRGGLAVDQGRMATAARLLGTASSYKRNIPGGLRTSFSDDVAAARAALGTEAFEKAWSEGAAMSSAEAVAYASRGRGAREERSTKGWASLTRAERQVTDLVVEGLTNAEIAERQFISPRTVGHHLSHIYAKLGISSRRELARAAVKRQARS